MRQDWRLRHCYRCSLLNAEAVGPLLDHSASRSVQARMALQIVDHHEADEDARNRVRHRALYDAWSLFRIWYAIAGVPASPRTRRPDQVIWSAPRNDSIAVTRLHIFNHQVRLGV